MKDDDKEGLQCGTAMEEEGPPTPGGRSMGTEQVAEEPEAESRRSRATGRIKVEQMVASDQIGGMDPKGYSGAGATEAKGQGGTVPRCRMVDAIPRGSQRDERARWSQWTAMPQRRGGS